MKFLFVAAMLTFSLNLQARDFEVFTVSITATVEDDVGGLLDDKAVSLCGSMVAKRVSRVQTDYKSYRYSIRAWANYTCVQ